MTGEPLWFCSDTKEGFEIVRRGRANHLVWMPLFARFDNSLSCSCLILMEEGGERYGGSKGFVKSGDRVYRRMGTGNFGRLVSMLRATDLVWSLGSYSNVEIGEGKGGDLAKGFKRKETEMQEFVLI